MSPGVGRRLADQLVVLALGDTLFGVKILDIKRILNFTEVTRTPRAPRFLAGIINHQGKAIPVVDLGKRLSLKDDGHDARNPRIVITEVGGELVGMIVDAVTGIIPLTQEKIEAPPEMVAQVNGIYLAGVTHHDDRMIMLLDISRVLSPDESAELGAWAPPS